MRFAGALLGTLAAAGFRGLSAESGALLSADAARRAALLPPHPGPEQTPHSRRRAEGPNKVHYTRDAAASRKVMQGLRTCGACAGGDGTGLVRVGDAKADGGYVMCKDTIAGAKAGLSIGIRGSDEWGAMLSEASGAVVHEFDCFDPRVPKCGAQSKRCELRFNSVCAGAGNQKGKAFKPFEEMVREVAGESQGDLVLKMDCEGCEWDVLSETSDATLQRFRTIVLEVHGLENQRRHEQQATVLAKLRGNFRLVHTHGANCAGLWKVNGTALQMPAVVETTWVRKDYSSEIACRNSRYLPDLDAPICNTVEENYPQGFPEYAGEDFKLDIDG